MCLVEGGKFNECMPSLLSAGILIMAEVLRGIEHWRHQTTYEWVELTGYTYDQLIETVDLVQTFLKNGKLYEKVNEKYDKQM